MKNHRLPGIFVPALRSLSVAIAALLVSHSAQASTYYWDNNGATSGFGTAGTPTSTWNATTGGGSQGWSTDSTGASTIGSVTTSAADSLNFGSASAGLAGGPIVLGTVAASNLTFGSLSGAISLSGGSIAMGSTAGVITVNNTSDTISTPFTGSNGYSKEGSGTLIITGSSAAGLTGNLAINNGSVRIDGTGFVIGNSSSNTVTVASGASLIFNRSDFNTNPAYIITGAGGVAVTSATGSGATFSAANTYTGGTSVSSGTLRIGAATSALGTSASAVSVASGAILDLNGFTITTSNALTLNGAGFTASGGLGGALVNGGGGGATYSGLIALGSDSTIKSGNGTASNITLSNTGTITGSGFALTLGGGGTASSLTSIIGTGAGTLTKQNSGAWTLTAANTFRGATKVSAGILTLSNALALQNSALDTANSIAGTSADGLKTTVTTLTLGGLTGNKNLASVFTTSATGGPSGTTALGGYSGVTALTLNPGSGATPSYSGVIANGASGMTLTKTGAGAQTLSGVSSYTGATSVQAGTLVVTGAIHTSSGVSVSNGATLAGESSDSGATNGKVSAITLSGGAGTGGVLAPGNGTAGDLGTLYGTSLAWNGATDSAFSQMLFNLGSSNASDKLVLSGAMTKGTGSIFEWDFGNTGVLDSTYTLVTATGGFGSGGSAFNALDFTYKNLTSGLSGSFTISGSNLNFTTFSAVPEPTSALAGLLLGVGLLRRRRAKA